MIVSIDAFVERSSMFDGMHFKMLDQSMNSASDRINAKLDILLQLLKREKEAIASQYHDRVQICQVKKEEPKEEAKHESFLTKPYRSDNFVIHRSSAAELTELNNTQLPTAPVKVEASDTPEVETTDHGLFGFWKKEGEKKVDDANEFGKEGKDYGALKNTEGFGEKEEKECCVPEDMEVDEQSQENAEEKECCTLEEMEGDTQSQEKSGEPRDGDSTRGNYLSQLHSQFKSRRHVQALSEYKFRSEHLRRRKIATATQEKGLLSAMGFHRNTLIPPSIFATDYITLVYRGCANEALKDPNGRYSQALLSNIGAITTMANLFVTSAKVIKQDKASTAKFIITQSVYVDKIEEYTKENGVRVMCIDSTPEEWCLQFSELTSADEMEMPEEKIYPDDVVALPYSSGTTRLHKMGMLMASNSLENGIRKNSHDFYTTNYESVYFLGHCGGNLGTSDCVECVKNVVHRAHVEYGNLISDQIYLYKCFNSYNYYGDSKQQSSPALNSPQDDYVKFWENFGKHLKLKCIEDREKHKCLAPLLRFFSHQGEEVCFLEITKGCLLEILIFVELKKSTGNALESASLRRNFKLDVLHILSGIWKLATEGGFILLGGFVKGDIGSANLVNYLLVVENLDTKTHWAAQTPVNNSFGNSSELTKNNIYESHVLLEACKVTGQIRRFIHENTNEVYWENDEDAVARDQEASQLPTTNPYSATKAGAEMLVMAYGRSYGLPLSTTRGNMVCGLNQILEKLIPKFILHARSGKTLPIHGDSSNVRSHLYYEDVGEACEVVLHKREVGHEIHLCHICKWPFPNPRPSSTRRAYKKICVTLERFKSDLANSDYEHKLIDEQTPSPKLEKRITKEPSSFDVMGEKPNKSETVYLDAKADFAESSPGFDEFFEIFKGKTRKSQETGARDDVKNTQMKKVDLSLDNVTVGGKDVSNKVDHFFLFSSISSESLRNVDILMEGEKFTLSHADNVTNVEDKFIIKKSREIFLSGRCETTTTKVVSVENVIESDVGDACSLGTGLEVDTILEKVSSKGRLEDHSLLAADIHAIKLSHVVNVAVLTGRPNVDWCEFHKTETVRANVAGTLDLVDICRENRFLTISFTTGCIFEYNGSHTEGCGIKSKEEDIDFIPSNIRTLRTRFQSRKGVFIHHLSKWDAPLRRLHKGY